MNIRDHGIWKLYKPNKLPLGAPANAMFAHRVSDDTDWYDYVNSGKNFAEDSVKLTVVGNIVAAAVTDPTMLFPGGAAVLEISGAPVGDPQELFGSKVYDATAKTFTDQPPLPPPPGIADILRRLEALEKKGHD